MEGLVSLCCVSVGGDRYGVETAGIREVLGSVRLEPVPLAPGFVAGVVPYRGEILTVLSLGALLGGTRKATPGGVLVFASGEGELFGVAVDGIEGVASFERATWQENPGTLGRAETAVFGGSYRDARGLVVRLEPGELAPARLMMQTWADGVRASTLEPECTL
jgi:purine-binding chemotaxis protein CheW